MAVRDEDDVGREVLGDRSAASLERSEARDEQRIGEDADAVDLDEHGGVAEKASATVIVHLRSVPVAFPV